MGKIGKRLLTCVKLCKGDFVADIGTDHGYLPCYMVQNGLCSGAFACDIAPKPLESAEKNIALQGLDDKIQTILTNGLENVPCDKITDIVIAGMGGEMIVSILEGCSWIKRKPVNLVLQPMTKWDFLRRWLYENGFAVTNELACVEGRFVYSVMQTAYCEAPLPYQCDLSYLYFGRVSAETDDGREYIKRQCMRLEKEGRGLANVPEKMALAEEMIELAENTLKKN